MMTKLQWYEGLMAADPTLKIFLHYAKELQQQGDVTRAVDVLRKGLAQNPECGEARLLLAHLLYESGIHAEAAREAMELLGTMNRYPGFWGAMATGLQLTDPPLSACFRLIESSARGVSLSLADVFARGVQACAGDAAGSVQRVVPQPGATGASEAAQDASLPKAGPVTLRTRTMARLLAEQGDIAGALDIFRELLAAHPGDADLAASIARLVETQNTDPVKADEEPRGDISADQCRGAERQAVSPGNVNESDVQALLNRLADRLEARGETRSNEWNTHA